MFAVVEEFSDQARNKHESRFVGVCQPPLEGHKGSHIHKFLTRVALENFANEEK